MPSTLDTWVTRDTEILPAFACSAPLDDLDSPCAFAQVQVVGLFPSSPSEGLARFPPSGLWFALTVGNTSLLRWTRVGGKTPRPICNLVTPPR